MQPTPPGNPSQNPGGPDNDAGQSVFIARQPILDRKQDIFGYELLARADATSQSAPTTHTVESDTAFLFNALSNFATEQLFGDKLAFVNCIFEDLSGEHLEIVFPERMVLEIPRVPGDDPAVIADIAAKLENLRVRGFQIAGGVFAAAGPYAPWLPHLSFIKFDVQSGNPALAQFLAKKAQSQRQFRIVAEKVETLEQFKFHLDLGYDYFQGYYFAKPQTVTAKVVNPAFSNVLQLINLVSKEAELREIDEVIKRDPALSFKLLRYINSSGFGLMSEVTSFRHAVTLLGYRKLFRWLTLLLATIDKSGTPPAVIRTAVTRGRMMELLAGNLMSQDECDNAFITGVFSLLDTMLGVSMHTALASITLPEAVGDALLHHQGAYGPFLKIVEATERGAFADIELEAMLLNLNSAKVTSAHLEALAWTESLGL